MRFFFHFGPIRPSRPSAVICCSLFLCLQSMSFAVGDEPSATTILSVNPCGTLLTDSHPGDGTITRMLKQDGLNKECELFIRGVKLKGSSTHPWKYTTQCGFSFVLKSAGAKETVVAYRVGLRFHSRFVPQSELFELGGISYSAQKFINAPIVKARATNGSVMEVPLSTVISNSPPREYGIFNALISNPEALSSFQDHNYLVWADEKMNGILDFKSFAKIKLKNPQFILYDVDRSFQMSTIDFLTYLDISLSDFQSWVKQSAVFVEDLRNYSPELIHADLNGLIRAEQIEQFIENRSFILGL